MPHLKKMFHTRTRTHAQTEAIIETERFRIQTYP